MGLGNPGEPYARSRHNVGFLTVGRFTEIEGFPAPRRKFQVKYTDRELAGERVFVLEPETFMNRSGPAVREFLEYFGREEVEKRREGPGAPSYVDCLLVVHDDLDLPEGRLRFRARGTSGGHRGLASVIEGLSSQEFSRLKIGIGRSSSAAPADYVLEPLGGDEEKRLRDIATEAAGTLPLWLREGVEACANRFNRADTRLSEEEGGQPL